MSTTAAAARYIIAADDKTKGAVASVLSGFRTMERSAKQTVTRMNAAFALVAGMGLKRAFQNVFTETAKQSKEFAFALDDVKRSARNLLSSKDGAPAATESLRELAETLKDPAVVDAADKIASTLIRGFGGAAKATAQIIGGLTILAGMSDDEREKERQRILDLEGRIQRAAARGLPTADLEAMRDAAARREMQAAEGGPRAPKRQDLVDGGFGIMLPRSIVDAGNVATRRSETMRQMQENFAFLEGIEKKLGDGPSGDADFWEQLSRKGEMAAIKTRNAFVENMDAAARDVGETMRRTGDSIEEVGDIIGDKIEQAQASSVFVAEMQESLFGNVSGLLASAGDGADDFGVRMIDAFKKILADQATLALFKMLAGLGSSLTGSSGGAGFSGWVGAGLTSLFGGIRDSGGRGQAGKGYVIGTGAQPEMFVPDSAGAFYPRQALAGAGGDIALHVENHFHNMRDVTDAKMIVYAGRIADSVEARIRDQRRRGRF